MAGCMKQSNAFPSKESKTPFARGHEHPFRRLFNEVAAWSIGLRGPRAAQSSELA